jgi:hypothetical protein
MFSEAEGAGESLRRRQIIIGKGRFVSFVDDGYW